MPRRVVTSQPAAILLFVVAVLAWGDANAQTAGYRLARKPRLALAISGGATLASGYILGVVAAVVAGFGGLAPAILVPIAGPFIGLGWDVANPNGCPLNYDIPNCKGTNVDPTLAFAGGVQVVGATLLAIGLVPHDVRMKATVTSFLPTFAWHDGPRLVFVGRF